MQNIDINNLKNVPKRNMYLCLIFAIIGFAMMTHMIFIDYDYTSFAIMFVGIVIFFTTLISVFYFYKQSKDIISAITEKDILAVWNYNTIEWNNYLEKDYKYEIKNNKLKLSMIGVIMIIFSVLFAFLLKFNEFLFIAGVLCSVFLLVLGVAYG